MLRLKRILKLIPIAFFTITAYQNCGEGFQTASRDLTSLAQGVATPPKINFTSIPSLVNTSNYTYTFSVVTEQALSSVMCQFNNEAATDCSGQSVSYTNVVDGTHRVQITVRAVDGQVATNNFVFTKDSAVPTLAVSSAPSAVSNQATASFVFTAMDTLSGVDRVECSLDNAAFATCTSPANLSGLSVGNHNYRIRAYDRAGNAGAIYSYSWTIDLTVPAVMLTATPAAVVNVTTANFTFSGSGVVSYECQLGNAAYAACTSPRALTGLAANTQHTFRVRGTNAAGVVSSPAQYSWTVDTLSPTVPVLVSNRGAFTNQRDVSLTFSATDALSGIARYECLTGSTWVACTSPRALMNLADGSHSPQVRAVDNAGNISTAGTSAFQVDTAVPTVTFSAAPANNSTATSVSFTFAAADSASGINTTMCSLDNAAFAACTSPRAIANLAIGAHSFRVQATDRAGNSTAVSHNWTIVDMPAQSDYEQGVALYNINCAGCHSAIDVTNKVGRSAQLITAAIGSIPQMAGLSSLTPVQINLIALALKGPGGVITEGNKTLFACNASEVRTSTALRLTNREFIAALSALLNDFSPNASTPLSNDSALQTLFTNLPSDVSVLNSTQEENPFVLSQRATTGFFEASFRAATLVSTATTGLANYPNTANCLSAATITQACHRNFVRELATRAFRRTVSTTEGDTIANSIYNASLAKADLITETFAVVSSYPDFIYKAYNTGADTPSVTRQTTVTGLELANKLSFFLTGAPADAALRTAAAAGDLNNTATFSAQVDRLMASAAGQAHLIRLFRESYGHDVISNLQYNSTFLNGNSTTGLRDAMISELDYFFTDEVLTKRSSFSTLMTSRNSRVPASSLAQIYGVSASTSATTLPLDRAGFLTRAAYLTKRASYYTSPVRRGRHMMEQVLCENIPDPPANAPTSVPEDQGAQLLSTRTRYENLTQQPNTTCVACHTRMNAYGFALEGFDALGRKRSAERIFNTNGTQELGTVPVNTSAAVHIYQNDVSLTVRDSADLMTALGTSDKAIMCFAQHVRSFDVRQKVTSADYCEMNEMLNVMYGTNGNQGSVYDAIKAYVSSNRFRVWKY